MHNTYIHLYAHAHIQTHMSIHTHTHVHTHAPTHPTHSYVCVCVYKYGTEIDKKKFFYILIQLNLWAAYMDTGTGLFVDIL